MLESSQNNSSVTFFPIFHLPLTIISKKQQQQIKTEEGQYK